MDKVTIRRPDMDDLERLDRGLRQLSADLGDPYRARADDLRRALTGDRPLAHAVLAEAGGDLAGVAVFSPIFSTIRGAAGLYVSDLWVARAARGRGLGRRLLAGAAAEAARLWDARFLRLVVYDDNPAALRFYRRLGLAADGKEILMTLDESGLDALKGQR
ncbi:GNAT family N-acetyltransferase [Rhodovulum euryhalinum]|uniref:Ribosomal protein S18 acetylase RimI-like enzyme n=1 Tax=Rhodovulum euryhalinum TaxID=35805 RepID=A0A4R2L065_9RHOB|nr:GNAT family N-acetyltransferase [Rhodovulum euryhalinum]TCO72395.1 ribosomal protein S18 acetylase RimI-like enzyme [Rhodovulum euryhalinum]